MAHSSGDGTDEEEEEEEKEENDGGLINVHTAHCQDPTSQ